MREMMWIYVVIMFLSEAWSLERGTNESTPVNNTSSINVYREEAFNNGSYVNLTCSNKTWDETFYVIWNIQVENNICKMTFSTDGRSTDTCKDHKSLRNTSSAQSYLHIPNFSENDMGVYKCESAYRGGTESYEIKVSIAVPPEINAWLEHKNNTMVAVCQAKRGNPAANISWSHAFSVENYSAEKSTDKDELITVESRVELPEDMDPMDLSCTISHQSWNKAKILFPRVPILEKVYIPWLCILIVVMIIAVLAGFLFFAFIKLRQNQQSDISTSKSPPIEDVEEVEPYASYVQRVNSIYN